MKVTVEITRRLDCYEPTTEQAEGHITASRNKKTRFQHEIPDFDLGKTI